jgi:hypothetical protein
MKQRLIALLAALGVGFGAPLALPAHAEPVHLHLASSVSSEHDLGGLASIAIWNSRADTVPAYVLILDADGELAAEATLSADQPVLAFDSIPTTYRLIVALAEAGRETIAVALPVGANVALTVTID